MWLMVYTCAKLDKSAVGIDNNKKDYYGGFGRSSGHFMQKRLTGAGSVTVPSVRLHLGHRRNPNQLYLCPFLLETLDEVRVSITT